MGLPGRRNAAQRALLNALPTSGAASVSFPTDYPALLATIDSWQAEARANHPGIIPCRAGCAACCHGPFDLSVADALLVRNAVRALPAPDKAEVRRRAQAQMDQMRGLEPSVAAPYDLGSLGESRFDLLVDSLEEEPCPALDDHGACRIYAARPMICRLIGLGVLTPDGQVVENACPIQADYPAYQQLPPQRFDLDAWDQADAPARLLASEELFGSSEYHEYETTVAGAILLDVSGVDTALRTAPGER